MRTLLWPLMWAAAIMTAIVLYRRIRRGKVVVLRGRFGPATARMIVITLVVLGLDEGLNRREAKALPLPAPAEGVDPLPEGFKADRIGAWLSHQHPQGQFGQFAKTLALWSADPNPSPKRIAELELALKRWEGWGFTKLLAADVAALKGNKPVPVASVKEVAAAVEYAENYGLYNHWVTAFLWRKTAGITDPAAAKELIGLYERLARHARITDALIKAAAEVRPAMESPHAWMSKAGPRPEQRIAWARTQGDMLAALRKALPTVDQGTWRRDGQMILKTPKDAAAPRWVRAGRYRELRADQTTRLGRLDLLETGDKPAAAEHDWLGRIDLPANGVYSVWMLPNLLGADAKAKIDKAVASALDKDDEAAEQLERALPLAHARLRAALVKNPDAKGAPKLRLILSLFDDVVMPPMPEPAPVQRPPVLPGVGGPGAPGTK